MEKVTHTFIVFTDENIFAKVVSIEINHATKSICHTEYELCLN